MRIPDGLRIIQVQDALARLRGRGALYLTLVKLFVGQVAELAANYRAAADAQTQASVTHKIKGTAGNLGMGLLYDHALEHEVRAKAGLMQPPEDVADLCALLESTLLEAQQILALNAAP